MVVRCDINTEIWINTDCVTIESRTVLDTDNPHDITRNHAEVVEVVMDALDDLEQKRRYRHCIVPPRVSKDHEDYEEKVSL